MRKRTSHGFVMLEVMVTMMICTILISTFYLLIQTEYRQVRARIEEEEAYYAAVSAVRMMKEAVISGEYEEGSAAYELTHGDGAGKYKTRILFEPDDESNKEMVEIPVVIWSERDKDELVLAAEAKCGGKTKLVSLRMVKTIVKSEDGVENSEETEQWIAVAYESGT